SAWLFPSLVGLASVLVFAPVSWDMFIAMIIAILLIQSATNMFNEYFDFKRGLDSAESVGIAGAIVRNGMSPRLVLNIAVMFYIIAGIIGIYISINSSLWILAIGAVSMAV